MKSEGLAEHSLVGTKNVVNLRKRLQITTPTSNLATNGCKGSMNTWNQIKGVFYTELTKASSMQTRDVAS